MGLRFIIGRSGSGKTSFCINEIVKRQHENRGVNLIYIVPEQYSLQAEKDLIDVAGKGIMSARVLSFGRLAYTIFSEMGGTKKAVLGDIGKNMTLKKIAFNHRDELKYYKGSVDKAGFITKLSSAISEFFTYGIDENKIAKLMEVLPEGSPIKDKISDLKIIFDDYKEFIKQDYITADDTLDILVESINNSKIVSNSEIWIDGFYGFSPQEYNVIKKLLKTAKSVNITLTIDECDINTTVLESPFFEPAEAFRRLKNISAEVGVSIEKPVIFKLSRRYKTECMAFFEKEYFNYTAKYKKTPESIKLVSASNKYGEIEVVASEIIALVRDKGMRYRDIAVLTGALKDYKKTIEYIFTEYDIPYFIDSKIDVLSHPLIELVRAAASLIPQNFSYESVFRYLKTSLSGIEQYDVDLLENYVLACGIKGYKWNFKTWEKGFIDESEKEKLNSIKHEFMESISPITQNIKPNKKYSVKYITLKIYELITGIGVTDKLQSWIDHETKCGNHLKASQHKQCWEIVINVFDKLVEIFGEYEVTIDEYEKILGTGFEESELGVVPPGVDRVIAGDIERTRLPEIKALFVIGANEGLLPAPSDSGGLFEDSERQKVESLGFEIAHSSRRKVFEDSYLIYRSITHSSYYLWILYSKGNVKGESIRPASIVSRIKRLFPFIQEYTDSDFIQSEAAISSYSSSFHILTAKLRDYAENGSIDSTWIDVFNYFRENEYEKISFLLDGLTESDEKYYLNKSTVRNLYGDNLFSSVSKLERYVSCPFSFFMQYAIKAKDRKLFKIDTPDLGILFHSVLERFSLAIEDSGENWRSISKQKADKIVSECIAEVAPTLGNEILLSSSSYSYLLKRLERISKRAVYALIEHIKRSDFEPFGYEVGFGKKESLPPIIVELSNGERMIMTGKIDRIDIYDNNGKKYVRIIDYKSGSKKFNVQDIYYGLQLQLMLYMDAFIKNGGNMAGGELFPAGIFYFRINDPMISSAAHMDDEQINNMLFKELKMSGLVVNDFEIIKALDNSFKNYSYEKPEKIVSDIIPVSTTAKGDLGSSSVANSDVFKNIMEYAIKKAKNIGEDILSGKIAPQPYKDNQHTPCQYCGYSSICGFNKSKGKYRKFKKVSINDFKQNI